MARAKGGSERGADRRARAALRRLLPALLCTAAATADAHVVAATAQGFTVEQVREVAVAPEVAWARFVDDVPAWYDGAHTYGGRSDALTLDAVPGGCFCERWAGGEVEHLRVVMVQPGRMLRMRGGLGPLQGLGVEGAFTVVFEAAADGGTTVRLVYAVGGWLEEGLEGWAAPVDGVLAGHMDRFAALWAGSGD